MMGKFKTKFNKAESCSYITVQLMLHPGGYYRNVFMKELDITEFVMSRYMRTIKDIIYEFRLDVIIGVPFFERETQKYILKKMKDEEDLE